MITDIERNERIFHVRSQRHITDDGLELDRDDFTPLHVQKNTIGERWANAHLETVKNIVQALLRLPQSKIDYILRHNAVFIATTSRYSKDEGYVIDLFLNNTIAKAGYFKSNYYQLHIIGSGSFGQVDLVGHSGHSSRTKFIRKIAKGSHIGSHDNLKFEAHVLQDIESYHASGCSPFVACYHDYFYNPIAQHHELILRSISKNVMSLHRLFHKMKKQHIRSQRRLDWNSMDYYRMDYLYNRRNVIEPPWTSMEKLNIFCELIQAVDYIHQVGVAHRDLHSPNVILYDRCHVYLIDFGGSCFAKYDGDHCHTENPGRPSIAKEMHNVDEDGRMVEYVSINTAMHADWFSVGMLLYQLVNKGSVDSVDENGRMQAIIKAEFPDLETKTLDLLQQVLINLIHNYMSITSSWIKMVIYELIEILNKNGMRRSQRQRQRYLFPTENFRIRSNEQFKVFYKDSRVIEIAITNNESQKVFFIEVHPSRSVFQLLQVLDLIYNESGGPVVNDDLVYSFDDIYDRKIRRRDLAGSLTDKALILISEKRTLISSKSLKDQGVIDGTKLLFTVY